MTNKPEKTVSTSRSRNIFLVDYETTTDPVAEAFRMLRLQIQTSMGPAQNGDARVILVTSALEKEGKTTIACNLAQMCAIAHIPTLLIDTDLRKPAIHNAFNIPRTPGITDELLSDDQSGPPIVETLIPNLHVLPAGKFTKHTTEVLGSPPFRRILSNLKKRYSLIILDTPPAGVVADVGVLVKKVDAIYLVIRAGATKIRTVKQVVRTLRDLGGNVQGIILSRINPRRDKYYYYHNYPNYYSSYYQEGDSKKKGSWWRRNKQEIE